MSLDLSDVWKNYRGSYNGDRLIDKMVGLVFTKVYCNDDRELIFECDQGVFKFYHQEDCCESVYIESIVGDLIDLVGEPLLVASKTTSGEDPPWYNRKYAPESLTWSFYKFATRKGYVDVRWKGESNGYYSESVDVEFRPKEGENDVD